MRKRNESGREKVSWVCGLSRLLQTRACAGEERKWHRCEQRKWHRCENQRPTRQSRFGCEFLSLRRTDQSRCSHLKASVKRCTHDTHPHCSDCRDISVNTFLDIKQKCSTTQRNVSINLQQQQNKTKNIWKGQVLFCIHVTTSVMPGTVCKLLVH